MSSYVANFHNHMQLNYASSISKLLRCEVSSLNWQFLDKCKLYEMRKSKRGSYYSNYLLLLLDFNRPKSASQGVKDLLRELSGKVQLPVGANLKARGLSVGLTAQGLLVFSKEEASERQPTLAGDSDKQNLAG